MDRAELLQPLFDEAGRVDASIFDGWEVIPGYIRGEHAITVVLKGTEIHAGITPAFRKRVTVFRRESDKFFAPLLERMGFLTTRVLVDAHDKRRFVERVGFKPTWADGTFQYYLLGQLPFARRPQ